MNIFKGMRRLTLVLGIVGAGYAAERAGSQHTYLQLGYRVTAGGKELVKSLDCPSLDDGVHRQSYRTAEGNPFEARICFPGRRTGPREFDIDIPSADGKRIAYRVDTPEAEVAMRTYVTEQFRLSPADLAYAEQAYRDQWRAEKREKLLEIAVLLALYFGIAAAIGWIIRGFADIPYGSDRRHG